MPPGESENELAPPGRQTAQLSMYSQKESASSAPSSFSIRREGAFHLFDEAVEVVAGARDGNHRDGGRLPHHRLVHLRHGDIETLLQLVFERTNHLPPVLERLGVLDADFQGQLGYGHGNLDFTRSV